MEQIGRCLMSPRTEDDCNKGTNASILQEVTYAFEGCVSRSWLVEKTAILNAVYFLNSYFNSSLNL